MVGAYQRFIQERFERCLDLYLCPRTIKQKLDIDPESLIPKLPSPKDLRPFPTKLSIVYRGHEGRIRSFAVDPTGQWLASGSDDMTVKIWEIATGRNLETFKFEDQIMSVTWNPNQDISLIAVSSGTSVVLMSPRIGTDEIEENTIEVLSSAWNEVQKNTSGVEWSKNGDGSLTMNFKRVFLP
jgi:ribosome biogenesis protein ERB1